MSRVLKWIIPALLTSVALTGCGQGFQSALGFSPSSILASGGAGGGGTTCCQTSVPVSSVRAALLDNPGFETDLTGWDDWGNSAITTSAHTGGKALRVSGGAGGRGQEVIYRLKTGGKYQLDGFARMASGTDEVYLGIRFLDNGNGLISDQKVQIHGAAWALYSVQFTVPLSVSSARVYVYKKSTGPANVDFDDLALSLIGAPADAAPAAPIGNPSRYQPTLPGAGTWSLVFNDDFDADTLDTSKWNTGFWFDYMINNELHAYRPENVRLISGWASLVAEHRPASTTWGEGANYASAAINTRGLFSFTFGVVEARLRVPHGAGFHPQFWLLPYNKRSPPEMDLVNVYGQAPNVNHMTYEYMDDTGTPRAQVANVTGTDLSADFHTLTMEWLPDHVAYFVDGVQVERYTGDFVLRDPAFLIFNLAIGGDQVGTPTAATIFPQDVDIDYVRVWQKP